MIEPWQVEEVLRPRFGSALVEDAGFCEGAASLLQSYAPYKDSFDSMASRVEDYIFNALYDRVGSGMTVRLDNGTSRRILTKELPEAADDVMGVLFDSLRVYSVNYESLHEYCMRAGSFTALRALYTRFSSFMPESERQVLARVIRSSYPSSRWEGWLENN